MSTRSAIIRKTDYGYEGIYCHFDGYTSGVGAILQEHYQDAEKVKALIALGDISSLSPEVAPPEGQSHSYREPLKNVTVTYHRDRGEEMIEQRRGATIEGVADQIGHNGYVYVFDNGWTCNGRPIPEVLAEEAA